MKKYGLIAILLTFLLVPTLSAHSTAVEVSVEEDTVTILALFDGGEVMSEAQITVYAPDNPREAYSTGFADTEGNYSFQIDRNIPGTWDVTIRLAGHGEIIRIPVGEDGQILEIEQEEETNNTRRLIGGVVVVAALLGVGAYFAKGNKKEYART